MLGGHGVFVPLYWYSLLPLRGYYNRGWHENMISCTIQFSSIQSAVIACVQ